MKEKGPAATGALEEDSCYAMDRSRGGPGPQSWGAVAVTCGMRIQPPAFCGLCGDGLASCRAGVTTELPPVQTLWGVWGYCCELLVQHFRVQSSEVAVSRSYDSRSM
jgi:hypothetical protein